MERRILILYTLSVFGGSRLVFLCCLGGFHLGPYAPKTLRTRPWMGVSVMEWDGMGCGRRSSVLCTFFVLVAVFVTAELAMP